VKRSLWWYLKRNPWQYFMIFICPPLLIWSGYWLVWDIHVKDWEGVAYAVFGIVVCTVLGIGNYLALLAQDRYDRYYTRSKGVS
jgi:hypothetical protein